MIEIKCDICQRMFNVPDNWIGPEKYCEDCEERFVKPAWEQFWEVERGVKSMIGWGPEVREVREESYELIR